MDKYGQFQTWISDAEASLTWRTWQEATFSPFGTQLSAKIDLGSVVDMLGNRRDSTNSTEEPRHMPRGKSSGEGRGARPRSKQATKLTSVPRPLQKGCSSRWTRRDLVGLPPTWIGVGDVELFYDEDRTYADRLRDAGNDTTLVVVPGAPHAFESIAATSTIAIEYVRGAHAWLHARMYS